MSFKQGAWAAPLTEGPKAGRVFWAQGDGENPSFMLATDPGSPSHRAVGISSRSGRPIRTFNANRICAEEGCTTILSRYSPDMVCWIHRPKVAPVSAGQSHSANLETMARRIQRENKAAKS